MPQPIGRDLEQTRKQLETWLATRLPDAESIRVEGLRGPKDTGFSSYNEPGVRLIDTDGRGVERALVIRLGPIGDFGVFPR